MHYYAFYHSWNSLPANNKICHTAEVATERVSLEQRSAICPCTLLISDDTCRNNETPLRVLNGSYPNRSIALLALASSCSLLASVAAAASETFDLVSYRQSVVYLPEGIVRTRAKERNEERGPTGEEESNTVTTSGIWQTKMPNGDVAKGRHLKADLTDQPS